MNTLEGTNKPKATEKHQWQSESEKQDSLQVFDMGEPVNYTATGGGTSSEERAGEEHTTRR